MSSQNLAWLKLLTIQANITRPPGPVFTPDFKDNNKFYSGHIL